MFQETYDFYSPSNIRIHDLDRSLRDSLGIMENLDYFTKVHCQNVSNLTVRICQYMKCNNQFTAHCMIAAYIHDVGKLFIPKEILFIFIVLITSIPLVFVTLDNDFCTS